MLIPLIRLAIALPLLLYASACDVATREVPDWIWILGVPACLLLDALALALGTLPLLPFLLSMGVALLLGAGLCLLGFYGGADGRALVLVAAALPTYPSTARFLLPILPPLILVFVAATLCSAVYPLTILTLNLRDRVQGKRLLHGIHEAHPLKRLLLHVTARRVPLETLKAGLQYFPAETVTVDADGVARRTPLYFLHAEVDLDDLIAPLEAHRDLFHDGVLASPTTPMIVFQTAGFLVVSLLLYGPF